MILRLVVSVVFSIKCVILMMSRVSNGGHGDVQSNTLEIAGNAFSGTSGSYTHASASKTQRGEDRRNSNTVIIRGWKRKYSNIVEDISDINKSDIL